MTHDDLFALPDATPMFTSIEESIGGRTVIVPVAPPVKAMFTGDPADGIYVDAFGQRWLVGTIDGVRCRQRLSYWSGGKEVEP